MLPLLLDSASMVVDRLAEFVAQRMAKLELPGEAAKYVVRFDAPEFSRDHAPGMREGLATVAQMARIA